MESAGARAVALPVDVANADAVFSAAERIEASLGPIDVWINDAMLTVFAPLHAMTADEFRRVTEATYLGFVHGTMAALRHMRARNRGIIIQIGSALAYREFRYSLPIAEQSMRSGDSRTPFVPNFFMKIAASSS
jgi:NAD(P)-dependent dehydrogenase (short-subunit alcohol dehydrogenase family)